MLPRTTTQAPSTVGSPRHMTIRELLAALAALEDGEDPPPGHTALTWERAIRRELRRRRTLLRDGGGGAGRLSPQSRRRLRTARARRALDQSDVSPASRATPSELSEAV